ncbi:MAG: hypothetical protein M3Z46_07200 [Actinomycetota bacterium]|nr:hypothetical protein [Actinomycetota bacterium]
MVGRDVMVGRVVVSRVVVWRVVVWRVVVAGWLADEGLLRLELQAVPAAIDKAAAANIAAVRAVRRLR